MFGLTTKETFIHQLKEMVETKLGVAVRIIEFPKQGFTYTGMVLDKSNEESASVPVCNLDALYDDYCAHPTYFSEIVDNVCDILTTKPDYDLNKFFDWEYVSTRLYFSPVEISSHQDYLKDKVYFQIGDFAMIVRILVDILPDKSIASTPVSKQLLENSLKVSEKEVIDTAKLVYSKVFDLNMRKITRSDNGIDVKNKFLEDIYIVSATVAGTDLNIDGAAMIFMDGVMEMVHERIGDYYLVPVNTEKVVCIPKSMLIKFTEDKMKEVLSTIKIILDAGMSKNPDFFLSDNLYEFNGKNLIKC